VNGGAHILLVEDDSDLRVTLAELLELQSHTVETAGDGAEALERLNDGFRPDVIVMDLGMPVMDGWQFSERLRRDPDWARIPLLVISALDGQDTPKQAVMRLRKPVNFRTLCRSIDACFDQDAQTSRGAALTRPKTTRER
jgi:CheY-like chemotaxis protein